MTTVAKNLFLARIAEDGSLSQKEIEGLLDLVFDTKDSFAQVDLTTYAVVDQFLEGGIEAGKIGYSADNPTASGVDENNRHILGYLGSGFPGSLVSFKSRLSRYFGIALPAFDAPLPELTLTRFSRDAKNPKIYHFAAVVKGTDLATGETYSQTYSFDYDASKKPQEQSYLNDPVILAAAADIFEALSNEWNLPPEERTFLTPEKFALFEEFNAKTMGFPNNGRDLTALLRWQTELVGPECDQMNSHDDPFPSAERLADASGPIPTYGDGTLESGDLQRVYGEACRIVGDGILSLLAENGVTIGFYDFDILARGTQIQTSIQAYAEYDFIADGPAGLCDFSSKKIFIHSRQNQDEMIATIVHEMGHAFNLLIQAHNLETEHYVFTNPANGSRQETFAIEFTGTQKSVFLNTTASTDEKGTGLDSQYAASNDAEWFAEKFLYVMLERAGRLDLLKHNPDHNPLLELSPILVDASSYLLMTKIVQTVEKRADLPEDFRMLMERGIDDALWESCWQASGEYDIWVDGDVWGGGITAIRRELRTSKGSPTLRKVQADWAKRGLEELYTAKPETDYFKDDFYRLTIMEHWEQRSDEEIRTSYLPDETGNYGTQWLADRVPDLKAVFLVIQVERTDLSLEEKGKILFENGIADEASLGFFCQGLTSLEPEQVKPILGKPELLQAAGAYATQKFAETSYLYQYFESELTRADQNLSELHPETSLATLERFAKAAPQDVRPWAYLAASYAALGRAEDARVALGKTVLLARDQAETASQIREFYAETAASYVAANRPSEALALYELTRPFTDDPAALDAKIRELKKAARRSGTRPTRSETLPPEERSPEDSASEKSGELTDEDLRRLIAGE